jgi:hypothetical protein
MKRRKKNKRKRRRRRKKKMVFFKNHLPRKWKHLTYLVASPRRGQKPHSPYWKKVYVKKLMLPT